MLPAKSQCDVSPSGSVDANQCSATGFSNTSPRIELTNLTKQRYSCLSVNATSYYVTSLLFKVDMAGKQCLFSVCCGKEFCIAFLSSVQVSLELDILMRVVFLSAPALSFRAQL